MAKPERGIVNVVFTKERADEVAGYCRPAGNTDGADRHPRIYKRTIRAERRSALVYVIVADAIPPCLIRSSLGEACVKNAGHKGRCYRNGVWWGEGKPENREAASPGLSAGKEGGTR